MNPNMLIPVIGSLDLQINDTVTPFSWVSREWLLKIAEKYAAATHMLGWSMNLGGVRNA